MIVLSLSHASVVPERGFSINKYLSIQGKFYQWGDHVALGLVKDHLLKVIGPTKVKITPKALVSVKKSFQRYNADLEAKREYRKRIEKEKAQRKPEIEENKHQGENLSQIKNDIANTKDDINSAEMILQKWSANDQIYSVNFPLLNIQSKMSFVVFSSSFWHRLFDTLNYFGFTMIWGNMKNIFVSF